MGLFIPPRANPIQSHCDNHTVSPLKSSYLEADYFRPSWKRVSSSLFKYFFCVCEKFNWQIESLFICLSTDERKEQHHEHPCTSYLASPTIVVLPHPRCPVYVNIYNTFPFCQTIQKNFIDMILPNASACISLNRNILWNYNTITPKKINMDLMTSSNLQSVFKWKCLWQIFF